MDKQLLEQAYKAYLSESKVDIGKGKFLEFLIYSYLENFEAQEGIDKN
jgi:hypothetical protein